MILVYADHDRGELDPLALQVVSAARGLDADVHALIVGPNAEKCVDDLASAGVRTVHHGTNAAIDDYTPRANANAVITVMDRLEPRAVLAAGTPRGSEVLAHVASIKDLPLVTECSEIALTGSGTAEVTRARWGGNLLERSEVSADVLLATVQAHAFAVSEDAGDAQVEAFDVLVTDADLEVSIVERTGAAETGVGLAEAKVVISGGRGMDGPEAFGMLEELADILGGAVGCSRVVTAAGWRPHAEQVGQTGTKVAPDLYIAFGISGATQHIAGCKSAKTLIAVNTDGQAPIMTHADYAVVDNLHTLLPVLIEKARASQGA
ncbi:MAG: electron transfer flavoprotein subunit alpha/FixB family protein [Actinomycetota bacterium]